VGEEVADEVTRASGDLRAIVVDREGPRLDLWRAAEAQLLSAGLAAGSIAASPLCTSCSPGLFYSHRRDRGNTGRMVTVAVRR
jgi:copper oxidase (laccase) domain-containing protein